MDTKTMIVLLVAIAMIGTAVWFATRASVERAHATAGATIARAQEHTKRAEGRHELLDFFGQLRR